MSTSDVAYVDLPPAQARAVAASELRGGLAWMAFGFAVLALSWRMDRLEAQHINPYTVPGLLPGLLGIVMLLLGGLLALRSWRRGGRLLRGPRFWLGAAIYVSASIVLLQAPQRAAEGRRLSAREVVVALAIGLASGWIITWVFQDAFLVRLP
jgi:hypothetical protein